MSIRSFMAGFPCPECGKKVISWDDGYFSTRITYACGRRVIMPPAEDTVNVLVTCETSPVRKERRAKLEIVKSNLMEAISNSRSEMDKEFLDKLAERIRGMINNFERYGHL